MPGSAAAVAAVEFVAANTAAAAVAVAVEVVAAAVEALVAAESVAGDDLVVDMVDSAMHLRVEQVGKGEFVGVVHGCTFVVKAVAVVEMAGRRSFGSAAWEVEKGVVHCCRRSRSLHFQHPIRSTAVPAKGNSIAGMDMVD